MKTNPKVKLIIEGKKSKKKEWCGPAYKAKIFYDSKLAGTFFVSRNSTKKPKTPTKTYGKNMECPPGKYFAFFNKHLIKKYPDRTPAIQIADEKFGNKIEGPEGIRTKIFIHIFKKETSGCLTLENKEQYLKFIKKLNKFDGLNKSNIVVEIEDKYVKK